MIALAESLSVRQDSPRPASLLSTPAEDPSTASEEAAELDHDLLRPGDVLGDAYEIRSKLGEGGMGQVYEAYDRRLRRHVAIKVAHPRAGVSVSGEARALAALRGHSSMITVYALGQHAGLEYAVMDLVRGPTLQQYLQRLGAQGVRASIVEIAEIGAAMAEGLAVVHDAGMAHRDVKPANVILASGNRAVITDFGIFKPECDRTTSKLVWGTPEYTAPEAAVAGTLPGELFLVDVYALGIVLFEMLTGSPPFQGRPVSVLARHIQESIPDPRSLRSDTPRELAALVLGMTSKAPHARPQSMREIAWQLRRLSSGAAPSRRRFRAVIAEDNSATATILTALVKEGVPDADVRIAPDGQLALDMVHGYRPDLLVVDVNLPVLSGLDLCMRLTADDLAGSCSIVGTSAMAEPQAMRVLRMSGRLLWLPKGEECSSRLPLLARQAWARMCKAQ